MPAKKRPLPATQLTLEGAPPSRAGGSPETRRKVKGPKVRGARATVGPGKGRPRPAGRVRQETDLAPAVRALEQVAESLHFTHESFAQSLLRLPRAEDYDPLHDILRRLAAAAPAWLESRAPAPHRAPLPHPEGDGGTTAAARSAVLAARARLESALGGLPRPADYEPTARNLRELASVSPSLLDWLQEIPAMAAPLADSVAGLRAAIALLDQALLALDDEAPATSRVKVVVRG